MYINVYIYIYVRLATGSRSWLTRASLYFYHLKHPCVLAHLFKPCLTNLMEEFAHIYTLWDVSVWICWETFALRLWGPMVLRSWPQPPHWAKLCPWAKARGPGDVTKPYEIYSPSHNWHSKLARQLGIGMVYAKSIAKLWGLMTLGYTIHQISQCATLHFYHSLFAFSFCPIFLLACLNLEEQRSPTVSEIKMEHLKPFSQTPSQATKRCFWERGFGV